jgi:hypothetical protein
MSVALNFFAIDEEDAKKKLESIQSSARLLGPIDERIPASPKDLQAE